MLHVSIFFCLAINLFNQLKIEKSLQNEKWGAYKLKYQLKFSDEEDVDRKDTFLANYKFIVETNAKKLNFTLEMNEFGHLKKHERPRLFTSQNALKKSFDYEEPIFVGRSVPREKDWRKDGVISHVKNQHSCASGYAFSAVGAFESSIAIRTGFIPDLSEQEIVSCSKKYGNNGCMGGFPEMVYEYCMVKGLSRTIQYPYTGKESRCRRKVRKSSYMLGGYVGLNSGDEENLIRAVENIGPVSIVMDAMHDEFIFYQSGILDILGCSSFYLDHAALAVGYNLDGMPYLLVKNSFGVNWGERGYFKIALFKNNMCGIATRATIPIPLL